MSLKALSPTTKHVQERYANKPSCLLHCRGITMKCYGVRDKLTGSRKKKIFFIRQTTDVMTDVVYDQIYDL